MRLKDIAVEKAQESILITGSARSGTTIMGKIIHSMKDVEYIFEPPTLVSLFSLINKLEKTDWLLLYQTYLYEDFFNGAISGRNLNFNAEDDSCIYHSKPKEEIEKRLDKSLRKTQIEQLSSNGIIAYKIPDIVPFLAKYIKYIPTGRIIFMQRNPVDTINSLLNKGWFSDFSLNQENRIYPFQIYRNRAIPYWVPQEDFDFWLSLNELDRCGYYYVKSHRPPSKDNIIVVDYDNLLRDRHAIVSLIAEKLGLDFGELTPTVVESIQQTRPKRDDKILGKLGSEIFSMVTEAYAI